MGGRYINPFVSGDFLPLSGGTVTGDTVFSEGLTGCSLAYCKSSDFLIVFG